MRNKPTMILWLVFVFVVIAILVWSVTKLASSHIVATVTNIIDKPNQSEDGYYEITAQDKAGHQYKINATGYLNTPLSPESRGQACVEVPKVKIGDTVSFNLPKSENGAGTFDICYEKGLTGYYFTAE